LIFSDLLLAGGSKGKQTIDYVLQAIEIVLNTNNQQLKTNESRPFNSIFVITFVKLHVI